MRRVAHPEADGTGTHDGCVLREVDESRLHILSGEGRRGGEVCDSEVEGRVGREREER